MNGINSAIELSRKGVEPFSPKPSYNLVDNKGTWVIQPYNNNNINNQEQVA